MRFTRACLSALLLAGTCTSVWAQRKVIETPAGTRLKGGTNVFGGTNSLAPVVPLQVPGGNVFDQIYRPGSIQFAAPEIGPATGPGTPSPAMDPLLRKRLIDEQSHRKNWAIENAARINRGTTDSITDRRRGDGDGRKTVGTGREPTAAEMGLLAVDPKYAREFQRNTANPAESALESARQRALRQQRGQDPNGPGGPDGPRDPADPLAEVDRISGADGQDKDGLDAHGKDRRGSSPLDALGRTRQEEAADRLAAQQAGDILGRDKASGAESVNPGLELLRKERESELADILGTGTAGASPSAIPAGDQFLAPTRAGRLADFQQFLASEPPATAPIKLGSDAGFPGAPNGLASPAAVAGLRRDLPDFTAPSAAVNLGPTAQAPITAPPRLAPQPAMLPFPVRGKGGF